MKLKTFSLITLFSGLAALIFGAVLPFIHWPTYIAKNGSIALIGGAEIPELLPKYSFWVSSVLGGLPLGLMIVGVFLIIAALVFFWISKKKK